MRHNFTIKQQKAMRERSGGICEAGKMETEKFYGMTTGKTCHHEAQAFDHVTADALKRSKIQSIDEGLHVCLIHHKIKTKSHDMPKIRKAKRIDEKLSGIKRQGQPIPGSRNSPWKRKFNGTVERRS